MYLVLLVTGLDEIGSILTLFLAAEEPEILLTSVQRRKLVLLDLCLIFLLVDFNQGRHLRLYHCLVLR